jgi:very-short-patch-repair endonuclease
VSPFVDDGNARFMAIDIACRDRMIAVEFNGPSHYNTDGRSNGKTTMKKRLLEKLGWRVIVIGYAEWEKLRGRDEKTGYLKGMLGMER